MNTPDYLFMGVYPNAYVYSDKTIEVAGDYKQIARVYFQPLSIKIYSNDKKYAEAIAIAKKDYQHLLNTLGQPIEISATGQTTIAKL